MGNIYSATVTVPRVCDRCSHRFEETFNYTMSSRSAINEQATYQKNTTLYFCPKCHRIPRACISKVFPQGVKAYVANSFASAMERFRREKDRSAKLLPWVLVFSTALAFALAGIAARLQDPTFRPTLNIIAGCFALLAVFATPSFFWERYVWVKASKLAERLPELLAKNDDSTIEGRFGKWPGSLLMHDLENGILEEKSIGVGRIMVRFWCKVLAPL